MFIKQNIPMVRGRILFWTALVCAIVLPLVAQAEINAVPFAAPANFLQLTAQQCQMPNCPCPCCKHHGGQEAMSGCGCLSVSLICLPSTGASEPLHRSSLNFLAVITAIPKIITADIFRPPQA